MDAFPANAMEDPFLGVDQLSRHIETASDRELLQLFEQGSISPAQLENLDRHYGQAGHGVASAANGLMALRADTSVRRVAAAPHANHYFTYPDTITPSRVRPRTCHPPSPPGNLNFPRTPPSHLPSPDMAGHAVFHDDFDISPLSLYDDGESIHSPSTLATPNLVPLLYGDSNSINDDESSSDDEIETVTPKEPCSTRLMDLDCEEDDANIDPSLRFLDPPSSPLGTGRRRHRRRDAHAISGKDENPFFQYYPLKRTSTPPSQRFKVKQEETDEEEVSSASDEQSSSELSALTEEEEDIEEPDDDPEDESYVEGRKATRTARTSKVGGTKAGKSSKSSAVAPNTTHAGTLRGTSSHASTSRSTKSRASTSRAPAPFASPDSPVTSLEHCNKRTFKTALWEAINNPKFSDYIHWEPSGDKGIIPDKEKFNGSKAMKSITDASNVGGFLRQLNMWGFQRYKLKYGDDSCGFSHPLFQRGRPDLLEELTRKGENKIQVAAPRKKKARSSTQSQRTAKATSKTAVPTKSASKTTKVSKPTTKIIIKPPAVKSAKPAPAWTPSPPPRAQSSLTNVTDALLPRRPRTRKSEVDENMAPVSAVSTSSHSRINRSRSALSSSTEVTTPEKKPASRLEEDEKTSASMDEYYSQFWYPLGDSDTGPSGPRLSPCSEAKCCNSSEATPSKRAAPSPAATPPKRCKRIRI